MNLSDVKHHSVTKRPTGTTALLASLLVIAANAVGAHIDATTAATIIGALSGVVSALFPNNALN